MRLGGVESPTLPGDDTDTPQKVVLVVDIVGRVLSLLRRRFRIRQVDMAKRLDWPQSAISRTENGEVNLTLEQVDAWCVVIDEEAERVRPGAMEVTASIAIEIAEALSDALAETGVRVRWGAASGGDVEALWRGTELENFLVDHWPGEHRDLL
jgi:transcriptional regulator with XRE-family HTH domain